MKKLARHIERELQVGKWKPCAVSDSDLQRLWPLNEKDRDGKIAQFAKEYGFRLIFYDKRMGAIFGKAELERKKAWHSGLSIKTYTILNGAEITSRQEVKKLLGKGDYEAYLNSSLRMRRNFGWKAWQELCVWSGLPCPTVLNSNHKRF